MANQYFELKINHQAKWQRIGLVKEAYWKRDDLEYHYYDKTLWKDSYSLTIKKAQLIGKDEGKLIL